MWHSLWLALLQLPVKEHSSRVTEQSGSRLTIRLYRPTTTRPNMPDIIVQGPYSSRVVNRKRRSKGIYSPRVWSFSTVANRRVSMAPSLHDTIRNIVA